MSEKIIDLLDIAAAQTEHECTAKVSAIRRAAEDIPDGEPGECERCGEESLRLVFGACARCRDKYKLK